MIKFELSSEYYHFGKLSPTMILPSLYSKGFSHEIDGDTDNTADSLLLNDKTCQHLEDLHNSTNWYFPIYLVHVTKSLCVEEPFRLMDFKVKIGQKLHCYV
jgi:hypothetical protein